MIPDLKNDESGLTLIELMISIGVLTIVIVPITAVFILGLLESTSAQERVADSSTAQVISAHLLSDIQSSKTVVIDPATPSCQPSASDDVRLQLDWTDPVPGGAGDAITVSYFRRDDATTGQAQLYRAVCIDGGSPEESLLALNLDDTTGFVPACAPDCTAPVSVSVHVKAQSIRPDQDNSSYEAFDFDIEATRRVGS